MHILVSDYLAKVCEMRERDNWEQRESVGVLNFASSLLRKGQINIYLK